MSFGSLSLAGAEEEQSLVTLQNAAICCLHNLDMLLATLA